MPTVTIIGPYRFHFYANENAEPPHIHVERDDKEAKYWLDPVRLESAGGMSKSDLRRVDKLVRQHQIMFLEAWNEFFSE